MQSLFRATRWPLYSVTAIVTIAILSYSLIPSTGWSLSISPYIVPDPLGNGLSTIPQGNGLMEIGLNTTDMKHPIHDLIASGEKKWAELVNRQSKTLQEAVDEYKRRYKRLPPKGFDTWWKFASERNVTLVDEFNQIDRDIVPFFALPPKVFRQRMDKTENIELPFHIDVCGGNVSIDGFDVSGSRTQDVAKLIRGFAHLLPNLTIHASDADVGHIIPGQEYQILAARAVLRGEYLSEKDIRRYEDEERNPRTTVTHACLDSSPAVLGEGRSKDGDSIARFIIDPRATMDFCQNPSIIQTHGKFLDNEAHQSSIEPYFVSSKLAQGGELLIPALSGFDDWKDEPTRPWSKRLNSVFWRGRTTGSEFKKNPDWRKSHRIILHSVTNREEGEVETLIEDPVDKRLRRQVYPAKALNKKFMDVGLVGPAIQCVEYGTCEEMDKEIKFREVANLDAGTNAKYALDVDGNGWSQRYRRLLGSGSVLFKATIFPEWNSDWLVPYYHYVPIQVDYSDLYNSLLFFAGTPDGLGGHDDIAERISKNGLKFVQQHWRWADMEAYMFRLLLEYARLASPDRDEISYHGE